MLAYVLKTVDYKDNHKLVYFYTLEGIKSAIAYQTKKMTSKTRYILQPLTKVEVSFSSGKLPSCKEVELIDDYHTIKEDLLKYTYASHVLELVYGTIHEEDNHEKMFSFLHRLFLKMNNEDAAVLTLIFELKLLFFIGYGLQFKACLLCQEQEHLYFHPSSGGVVCSSHFSSQTVSGNEEETKILKELYYINIDQETTPNVDDQTKDKLRFLVDLLYEEFVGYKTKSLKIIKQLEKFD